MKKNQLKRAAAMGLTAVLVLQMLSACGGSQTAATTAAGTTAAGSTEESKAAGTSSAETTAAGTTAAASKDAVTISFGIWDEKQRPTMEKMAQAYEAENPNVKVDIQITPYKGGEYWTKLEAGATGGTAPDVFWINVLHAEDYYDGGILADLTDYIKNSDLKMDTDFPASLVKAYNFDGKQIAILKDFDTNALWYNKDIFDKAGVAYPTDDWTYDDMMKACEELKSKGLGDGVYAMPSPIDFQTYYYPTVFANGGYILNQDKTETGYADEKTQGGIQCWIDLITKGYSPSAASLSETSADALFEGGQAAMVMAGSYMTPEYVGNDKISKSINLVEYPKFNNVEPNVINGLGYAVYEGSKNKDAAAAFAIWLGGAEAMKIQGESGVVISARNDAQKYFAASNTALNLAAYTNHADTANPLPVCKNVAEIYDLEGEALKSAYSGEKPLKDVCTQLKTDADAVLAKNK